MLTRLCDRAYFHAWSDHVDGRWSGGKKGCWGLRGVCDVLGVTICICVVVDAACLLVQTVQTFCRGFGGVIYPLPSIVSFHLLSRHYLELLPTLILFVLHSLCK